MSDWSKEENDSREWGFDLTEFKPSDWKRFCSRFKVTETPRIEEGIPFKFITATGVKIFTGNNPITGEYIRKNERENEKGYASYIGITGERRAVMAVVAAIHELAYYIKDESPFDRGYI